MRGGLYVLGAVRVERDAGVTALAGTQPRAVLVYVVLAGGRPVPAEELATMLWPDGLAAHWEGALRGVVAKVRAVLNILGPDGPALENVGRSYRFVVPPGVDVDLARASSAVRDAEVAMAADRWSTVAELADEAAELLMAGLLPGVEADWLDPARARLVTLRGRALRLAAEARSALGRHDEAVARAETAVAADPFDEESHRSLIRALLASGRRAAALRAYSECRRLLVAELGVVPADETEALHLQALVTSGEPATEVGAVAARRVEGSHPAAPVAPDLFVGRHDLLAQLASAWDAARHGRRQIVLLHGEAGAGKTRLALEAARRAAPTHLGYGRCSPEQAVPFEPVTEALTGLVGSIADPHLTRLLERLGPDIAQLVPGVASRLDEVARPPRADGRDRAAAYAAVAELMVAIVDEPTIVVVDDLQWCEPSSLELLRHTLARLDRGRLLFLITYRDDGADGGAFSEVAADLCQLDGCRALPVGPLGARDVAELVGRRTGGASDDLVSVLLERSGGNAFYLQQILVALGEEPSRFDPTHVPATVSELVRHRVTGLPADAREAIAVAAVLGSAVDEVVLDRVVRAVEGDPGAIDVLVERGLLVEGDGRQLGFTHEIVRDAVYGRLTRRRRRRLHLAAARAWSAEPAGLEQAAAIAHHLLAADDPTRAHETLEALLEAAHASSRVRAYEQASRVLEQAEAVVSRFGLGDEATAITSLRLGAARRRVGRIDEAAASLGRAADLARSLPRPDLFSEAVLELVGQGWRGAVVELADDDRMALLEEAVEVAPRENEALVVGVLVALARTCLLAERLDRGVAAADEALATAIASGRLDLTVRAIEVQRLVEPGPEAAPARLAATEVLVGSSGGLGRSQRARLQAWRLADFVELGDRGGVEASWAALVRCVDELDEPHWRWVAASWDATRAALDGDADVADQLALRAVEAADGADQLGRMLAYGIQHVGFRLHQGRGDEVVDLLRVSVAASPEVAAMRAALALALAQAGDTDEAASVLGALSGDGLATVPRGIGWSTTLALLAATALELVDRPTAPLLLPSLEPLRDRFVLVGSPGAGGACWGPFVALSAGLRALSGDLDGASADFASARRAAEAFGSPALCEHVGRSSERWLGLVAP